MISAVLNKSLKKWIHLVCRLVRLDRDQRKSTFVQSVKVRDDITAVVLIYCTFGVTCNSICHYKHSGVVYVTTCARTPFLPIYPDRGQGHDIISEFFLVILTTHIPKFKGSPISQRNTTKRPSTHCSQGGPYATSLLGPSLLVVLVNLVFIFIARFVNGNTQKISPSSMFGSEFFSNGQSFE